VSSQEAGVLSQRALNRALLSRQLLLDRGDLPDEAEPRRAAVIQAVEHLVGLQAQAPFPPYYGLWSRLGGFRPDDLAELITDRSVVRIALMRGTIHLVSARDCLPLRRLLQPVLERALRGTFGKQLAGVDPVAVAAAGRTLVESEPMTFSQLGDALAGDFPDHRRPRSRRRCGPTSRSCRCRRAPSGAGPGSRCTRPPSTGLARRLSRIQPIRPTRGRRRSPGW
jgi:Winged helix DNA-binding domain